MSELSNIGRRIKDEYIHICDALDYMLKGDQDFNGISIYRDHSNDILIAGTSSAFCKAIISALTSLGRPCVFKSWRSIPYSLTCYNSKDYVEDNYSSGKGWFIEKPINTSRNTKYIMRHKATSLWLQNKKIAV